MLRKKRKELDLKPEEIAEKIGKKVRTYLYYEQKEDPTLPDVDTLQKLAKLLQFSIEDVYMEERPDEANKENATAEKEKIAISEEKQAGLLAQTLYRLAEANVKLADANQRQTRMLEQDRITVNDPEQTLEAFASIIQNLQEVITEVATGKRFQSKQEVNALLNKSDTSTFQKAPLSGTQKS